MKLKRAVQSDFTGEMFPAGTEAVIVERIDKDVVIAEVWIPDTTLVGGHRFDTVTIKKDDLED